MTIIFYITVLSGILYLICKKRQFDWMATAYISACIYFMPGFFGYVLYPIDKSKQVLENTAYGIMISVLLVLLLGMILADSVKNRKIKRVYSFASSGGIGIENWLAFIAVFMLFILLLKGREKLFSTDKHVVSSVLGREYILWIYSSAIGCVYTFMKNKKGYFLLFFLFMAFNIYLGDRTLAALTAIAAFTLWLNRQGEQRLISYFSRHMKTLLLCAGTGYFFFFYKFIYTAVKSGNIELILRRLGNPEFYVNTIIKSEPFTIQMTLNETVRNNFHVGFETLKGVWVQFIVFGNKLGIELVRFGDLFRSNLMEEYTGGGLASNIWAEMWSAGGFINVMLFELIYIFILLTGEYFTDEGSILTKSCVGLVMATTAFYIHRLDMVYYLNLSKRFVIIYIGLIFLTSIFRKKIVLKNAH